MARASLLVLLLASPLAMGAVQPWAWGAMTAGISCIAVLWGVACVQGGEACLLWSPVYVPALVVMGLGLVQLMAHTTLDRSATTEALLKLALYVLVFFLAQHLAAGADSGDLGAAGPVILAYASGIAVFAIVQSIVSPGLLYGVIRPRWDSTVFGPYVYHNAYAGLMELLLPMAMAYAVKLSSDSPLKLSALFAVFICLASVFLSGSRGGLMAVGVELALFSSAMFPGVRTRRTGFSILLTGVGLIVLAGAFFFWLDRAGTISQRWLTMATTPEIALAGRDRIALDTLRMSRSYPRLGVGLGAFETAYPAFQTLVTEHTIDFAHSDYLQFFAETGLAGWILAPLSTAIFLRATFRKSRLRFCEPDGWLRWGAAVGVCGVLAHSCWDFNLHIPANAACFAAALALATLPSQGESV